MATRTSSGRTPISWRLEFSRGEPPGGVRRRRSSGVGFLTPCRSGLRGATPALHGKQERPCGRRRAAGCRRRPPARPPYVRWLAPGGIDLASDVTGRNRPPARRAIDIRTSAASDSTRRYCGRTALRRPGAPKSRSRTERRLTTGGRPSAGPIATMSWLGRPVRPGRRQTATASPRGLAATSPSDCAGRREIGCRQ